MDTDSSHEHRPGGTVEPAEQATIAKEQFQTPRAEVAERYELRDPFAEVTYRVNDFGQMIAKADQFGATKFYAVDADGKRMPVVKVEGVWQRAEARAPEAAAAVTRDQAARSTNVVPMSPPQAPPVASLRTIDDEADRIARAERLEAGLTERYIIKRAPVKIGDITVGQTEYRFRGDTSRVAFTESTFRLATDTNSPSVLRSMVDVAEARNWQTLRVSGNEDFKRLVWLEASLRGVKALGYAPDRADIQLLRQERDARLANRIEPARNDGPSAAVAEADKPSARGGGSRKAVLAAIEAVLVARRVPTKQRESIMVLAAEKLAQRLREGQTLKVKILDKTAPSHRPTVVPKPEVQRTRERAAPVR